MVLCSSRSEAMGHPTEESHSSIQITCNLYDFHYTTTRRRESNNEQINHKLQTRKYMNLLCYKNENSQNLWNENIINLTKANKYASLANQTCVAP